MQRREFISLFGGAAVTWPLAARAQPAGKVPTIGFLGADAAGWPPWTDAFVGQLRKLGWIEGRSIAIEYAQGLLRCQSTATAPRPLQTSHQIAPDPLDHLLLIVKEVGNGLQQRLQAHALPHQLKIGKA